ncbi:histidine phosphatase family protein [Pseudooceanicola sediminis]|uniref:Histidine phosphatase family protein n=1 Tax=Pseudooceanicola sediminis TaxID=2211117 RepID=A0A399J3H0_9RHOB|nr:histidine phosphatase family protein [Pseudooceanicola sediminis]KAA2314173.1 histidine phosphatase family protein [Puniceibacterium sp. HSS470]RII39968.1 histidine phosphatase family protein [Pseudooceanicola sediminis]|tara:strand:- start:24110 stop:24700 length:591 start_codon:yes stop_codon:yes gene_type:complete
MTTQSPTRIFLVRHGPTHAKALVGWSDLPADLSDSARISALSAFLPERARLVSSDLTRTRATADALQSPLRQRLPDAPGLREIHFGEWELKPFVEIDKSHPDLSRAFWTDPGECAAPGGESWNDMEARVSAALSALAAEGGDLIVVAHFAVILSQVARVSDKRPAEVLAHEIETLSVTQIDVTPEGETVRLINHVP